MLILMDMLDVMRICTCKCYWCLKLVVFLVDALIEFDEQAELMGSALVHCLQGANR